jgi:hypothetical protein
VYAGDACMPSVCLMSGILHEVGPCQQSVASNIYPHLTCHIETLSSYCARRCRVAPLLTMCRLWPQANTTGTEACAYSPIHLEHFTTCSVSPSSTTRCCVSSWLCTGACAATAQATTLYPCLHKPKATTTIPMI